MEFWPRRLRIEPAIPLMALPTLDASTPIAAAARARTTTRVKETIFAVFVIGFFLEWKRRKEVCTECGEEEVVVIVRLR